MNEEMNRMERIKNHVRKNKEIYILATVQVAVGIVVYKKLDKRISQLIMTPAVSNKIIGGTNNRIKYQAISMYGNVLGRPGIPVIATIGGKDYKFESIKLAADGLGMSMDAIRKTLAGHRDHVNGIGFRFAE